MNVIPEYQNKSVKKVTGLKPIPCITELTGLWLCL